MSDEHDGAGPDTPRSPDVPDAAGTPDAAAADASARAASAPAAAAHGQVEEPEQDEALQGVAYQAAQRASPWGYVFILGVLGILTGVAWRLVEGETGWVTQAWIFASILLTLAPLAWHAVDFFQSVVTRRGGAFLYVVLTVVLGMVLMVALSAMIIFLNSDEAKRRLDYYMPSWDMTESGRYTLGEETKRILDRIPGTVFATYLQHGGQNSQTSGPLRDMAMEQLKVYGYYAGGKIVVRTFDDLRDSDKATAYLRSVGVVSTSSGDTNDVIVLSYAEPGREVAAGKQKEIKVDDFEFARRSEGDMQPRWLGERVITSAIQELVFTRFRAYATSGHGEHSLSDDMRNVRERLRSQNVEVVDKPLELARNPEVPADCDLLLVLGPRAPFAPQESQAVDRWLDNGDKGRSLFLTLDVDRTGGNAVTGLEDLLHKYGMEPRIHYIVVAPFLMPMPDGRTMVEMKTQLAVTGSDYTPHPSVEPLRRGSSFGTFFIDSTFVEVDSEAKPDLTVDPVVRAPDPGLKDVPRPWAARLYAGRRDYTVPDPSRDKTGERLALVVVATRSLTAEGGKRDARVVVSGDTDVFSDQVVNVSAPNLDLFGGLAQWSLRREDLVAVSEKTLELEIVTIDGRKARMAFWWPLVTAFGALLAGAAVWWARRR